MPIPPDLITPKKAAALVGVSLTTIYRWMDDGTLKPYRVAGRRRRVRQADVEALVVEEEAAEPVRTTAQDERAAEEALGRMGHRKKGA